MQSAANEMAISAFMKKDRGLKGPTDYRPASNSYPVKALQRDTRPEKA
ncbi:MAG: hypothetical protein WB587_12650 [Nitrososphaeraceae archaeon]